MNVDQAIDYHEQQDIYRMAVTKILGCRWEILGVTIRKSLKYLKTHIFIDIETKYFWKSLEHVWKIVGKFLESDRS